MPAKKARTYLDRFHSVKNVAVFQLLSGYRRLLEMPQDGTSRTVTKRDRDRSGGFLNGQYSLIRPVDSGTHEFTGTDACPADKADGG